MKHWEFGAVVPLVAAAALAIINPPLAIWAVVMGIAVAAGIVAARSGQALHQLLVSVRERVDAGAETTARALAQASEEAGANLGEADKKLAERLERFFAAYEQREQEWRAKTLAELRTMSTQVVNAELAQMKETFALLEDTRNKHNADLGKAVATLRELVETETQRQQEQKQAERGQLAEMTKTIVEKHFAKWHESESELRQAVLAEWRSTVASFEGRLESIVAQERAFQEQASKSRTEAVDAELAGVKETFALVEDTRNRHNADLGKAVATLRELVATETQRQQEQKRAERGQLAEMTKTIVEKHFAKWHEGESELRQAALAEWRSTVSSFEGRLESIVAQERAFQEQASQSRTQTADAELAQMKETFALLEDTRNKHNADLGKAVATLRELVETETQRQQEQKRAERDHLDKMLERQQRAHDEAGERSGQLWDRLLNQLEK